MLSFRDLTYRIGGRTLLDSANAQVPTGRKIGLVGRNGTGKSTLLRLVAGEIAPDGGEIVMASGATIGTVAQQAPTGPDRLIDVVLAADRERTRLLAEAETAADPQRIAEIHERLADIGAHAAPARAAAILAGLGLDETAQQRPVGSFSGGWRMRVALAAALFAAPDLLLLDEPTNHLDLEATLWLEGFLATYPRTLLLVSHDRDLLNKVVDGILHLEDGKLAFYPGGYDRFERTRREALLRQATLHERQEAERKRIQAFVDRFRAKASKARQAQSRLKMLERMQPIAAVAEAEGPVFRFPAPQPLPPPLATLDDVAVGYDAAAPVLRHLDLRIDMDDRIALLGANGNGKTTLLRLLSGDLQPSTGTFARSPKLQVGYFAQDQLEQLDPDKTAYKQMARLMPDMKEPQVRAHLGRFGFSQEKAEVRIASLSGGEKARLVLACISREAPHLLLLDEPTNHLDIEAREALVQALNEFEGAVVLVTHDPHLIGLAADRLWLVADGACRPFDGDLDDYRTLLLAQRRDERRAQRSGTDGRLTSKQEDRRLRAEARAALAPLRKAAESVERRLDKLTAEKAAIEAELADPALYTEAADRLAGLAQRKARIEAAIAAAETEWLDAQEKLEGARAETS